MSRCNPWYSLHDGCVCHSNSWSLFQYDNEFSTYEAWVLTHQQPDMLETESSLVASFWSSGCHCSLHVIQRCSFKRYRYLLQNKWCIASDMINNRKRQHQETSVSQRKSWAQIAAPPTPYLTSLHVTGQISSLVNLDVLNVKSKFNLRERNRK